MHSYALSNDKLCEWEGSPRLDDLTVGTTAVLKRMAFQTECGARKQDVAYMIPVHGQVDLQPYTEYAVEYIILYIRSVTYIYIHL